MKPRPARTRRLYLMVGHRTTGRSLSMGRGATAAALAWRAFLRETFLPGYIWSNLLDSVPVFSQYDRVCSPSCPPLGTGIASRKSYLVEVGSDPTLPILAEVWKKVVSIDDVRRILSRLCLRPEHDRKVGRQNEGRKKLTVLDNGLVVLDRLYEKSKGQ